MLSRQPNSESHKQVFKLGIAEFDVPQLFCQLDLLRKQEAGEYSYWTEKARWLRFEETAESVLGRWSKPHVATLMQTAFLDLKKWLTSGVIILNLATTDNASLAQTVAQALMDKEYFTDVSNAQKLARILTLPHFHHHEKRSVTKTASAVSLAKSSGLIHASTSFVIHSKKGSSESLPKPASAQEMSLLEQEHKVQEDYPIKDPKLDKEYNVKLQRKLQRQSEGASILICPVDFVTEVTMVFVRLDNALELHGLLELKLHSRFIVLFMGPEQQERHLIQVGRAIATILTDD
ncbi:unnamed protein product, partial [Didymodactylos carnosus]